MAQHIVNLSVALQNVREVHYLDVGLNCRGAHLTDPQVLGALSSFARSLPKPLAISLHGTARQWGTHGVMHEYNSSYLIDSHRCWCSFPQNTYTVADLLHCLGLLYACFCRGQAEGLCETGEGSLSTNTAAGWNDCETASVFHRTRS